MAASVELTATADVKTHLGISVSTYDAQIAQIITSVSQWIESFCKRKFKTQPYTEYYNGHGYKRFGLRQYPVDRDAAFTIVVNTDVPRDYSESGDELATTEYTLDYDAGVVEYEAGGFPEGNDTVKVVYTAGVGATTAALPEDLQLAAIVLTAAVFNQARQHGEGQKSERVGPYAVTYEETTWPARVTGILANYRTRRMG